MYSSKDIFKIIQKRLSFYSKLNFGDSSSCYRGKGNVSARRSGNKIIARTSNYHKSDSGRALGLRGTWSYTSNFLFTVITKALIFPKSEVLKYFLERCKMGNLKSVRLICTQVNLDKDNSPFREEEHFRMKTILFFVTLRARI